MTIGKGLAAVLVAAMTCTSAAQAHFFPKKAKTIKSDLVQSYEPCTSPDTATGTSGKPACEGSIELDPSCVFGASGVGNLVLSIKDTDVKVKAKIKGLDPACEGETLSAAFKVRTTTDDCPNEHCTVADEEYVGGSCVVTGGQCFIDPKITVVPTGYPAGAGSEMTILECGVKHGGLQAFSCGIMVE